MDRSKNPKENKVTILGLGGSGGEIVHYIAKQCNDYSLLYMDSDEISLSESTVKTIKNKNNGQTDFVSLSEEIKDCQKLIITAGLGGEFGTFSSYIIYKMAKTENIQDIKMVLTMPATFEGRRRKNRAQEILNILTSNNIEYTLIELDNLIKNRNDKTSMQDCSVIMHDAIYKKVIEGII